MNLRTFVSLTKIGFAYLGTRVFIVFPTHEWTAARHENARVVFTTIEGTLSDTEIAHHQWAIVQMNGEVDHEISTLAADNTLWEADLDGYAILVGQPETVPVDTLAVLQEQLIKQYTAWVDNGANAELHDLATVIQLFQAMCLQLRFLANTLKEHR